MMYFMIRFLLIYLYIFTIIVTITLCFHIKSSPYRKLNIEDDKLCSPITKRKIELKKSEYHALQVTQSRTKDHVARWSKNFNCKFKVDASSYGGLFVVVQNLNFRRNEETGECIDYLRITEPSKNDKIIRKFCGDYHIGMETPFSNYEEYHDKLITYDGVVDTEIFISRERLEKDEKMDLKIIYTAFSRCKKTELLPCFVNDVDTRFCIDSVFFNDSLANCPNCFDEEDCTKVKNVDSDIERLSGTNGLSTKIILSAVTSLVVSFIVFIACIWICKKTGKVCWSIHFSESNRTPSRPQSRVIEMQNRPESGSNEPPTTPTAPEIDKDLPPSYDSLFPER